MRVHYGLGALVDIAGDTPSCGRKRAAQVKMAKLVVSGEERLDLAARFLKIQDRQVLFH
jgi:hypothetical protein